MMQAIDDYLTAHRASFEQQLCDLLRIPSVSTRSAHREDVRRAGRWMHAHFAELGLESEWIETAGHPIVFAESPDVPGRPTVLVYGHYDVQPPEPLDEWISPPFEPTVRDGNVYARGATDDKGQMFTHVKSAEAWLRTAGALPLKLKFLIEGEEEIGSEHLHAFVARHADRLACDCVVVSDTSQFGPGQPAITYGLRGIAFYQLRLTGPKQDLHSGSFGGAVTNPAGVLANMLAALVDAQGRITVPHFYDDVVAISDEERRAFAELPYDEAAFMRQIGVDGLTGEAGYTALERRWGRPTCDVHGLYSGYTGEGAKTAIPAQASASFSFRLVPDQKPEKIAGSLRTMLERLCPPGIRMELESHHGARGVVVDRSGPYLAAAARAIEAGFGKAPVMIREGGSIPVVSTFAEHLGVDTLLLGWGLNDDNTHSPNEKFHIADFHRAIKASAYLWKEISGIASRADNASST